MSEKKRTCDECDTEIDEDGFPLEDGKNCDWSHQSDCEKCGAVFCDMSC
jgi:hypothetical protein